MEKTKQMMREIEQIIDKVLSQHTFKTLNDYNRGIPKHGDRKVHKMPGCTITDYYIVRAETPRECTIEREIHFDKTFIYKISLETTTIINPEIE